LAEWTMHSHGVADSHKALEALRTARSTGSPYDIVIIGSKENDTDDLELIRAIKVDKEISEVRIILLTPSGRQTNYRRMASVGIDECLTKPVQRAEFYDVIVSVMKRTTSQIERPMGGEITAPAAEDVMRGRLLLAEDNQTNQAVTKIMLEGFGLSVDIAANGEEAIQAFNEARYDLIFMDCQMPGMDGYEATKLIRDLEKSGARSEGKKVRTPIIALTAHAMRGDKDACIAAGMDDYLTKPFKRIELYSVLRKWLKTDWRGNAPYTGHFDDWSDLKRDVATAAMANTITSSSDDESSDVAIVRDVLIELAAAKKSGDGEMVYKIIRLYIDGTLKKLIGLRDAANSGNAAEVESYAHALKSSSAAVGAQNLSSLMQELEMTGTNGEHGKFESLLEKIEIEAKRVIESLELELRERSLHDRQ